MVWGCLYVLLLEQRDPVQITAWKFNSCLNGFFVIIRFECDVVPCECAALKILRDRADVVERRT
jgi:hypothetical protein